METFKKCKVENCENKIWKKSKKQGYCMNHYMQLRKYGRILKRTRFDPNEIIDCGNYYEIILYGFVKKGEEPKEIARALIDKEYLEKVKNYKWHSNGKGYVMARINGKSVYLHHLIFGESSIGYEVDHRDTNPLNNRKYNLRLATYQQNSMNRKSRGITWGKSRNKWQAQIMINKKHINLGRFTNEQDAINARKEAEKKYFGEFAYKGNNSEAINN